MKSRCWSPLYIDVVNVLTVGKFSTVFQQFLQIDANVSVKIWNSRNKTPFNEFIRLLQVSKKKNYYMRKLLFFTSSFPWVFPGITNIVKRSPNNGKVLENAL